MSRDAPEYPDLYAEASALRERVSAHPRAYQAIIEHVDDCLHWARSGEIGRDELSRRIEGLKTRMGDA